MKTFRALAWSLGYGLSDKAHCFDIQANSRDEAVQKFIELAASEEWAHKKLRLEQIEDVAVTYARAEAYMRGI